MKRTLVSHESRDAVTLETFIVLFLGVPHMDVRGGADCARFYCGAGGRVTDLGISRNWEELFT